MPSKSLSVAVSGLARIYFELNILITKVINLIFVFQTILGFGESSIVSYYDTTSKSWSPLSRFPSLPRKDCKGTHDSCLNAEGNLYVARGTARLPRVIKCPQFLRLDLATNTWQPLQPMTRRRNGHHLVFLDAKIYTIGTVHPDDYDMYMSMEVYSIVNNIWQTLPSLPQELIISDCSCVAYQGKLLVYGTPLIQYAFSDNEYYLYAYDPITADWSLLLTCEHPEDDYSGLVTSGEKCYRVVRGTCKCKVTGCQWHETCIHQLVIHTGNGSAMVGEKQDQALLPVRQRKKFFYINGEVFTMYRKKFLRIGVAIGGNQEVFLEQMHLWWDLHSLKKPNFATSMLVDKEKWL